MNEATLLGDDRLDALRRLNILDTPPEESFDRFTRLAGRLLGVPVALISLVDADRQFFKSCVGLPEPWATRRETPLSHSFCQHVVASGAALVVGDAKGHPLVSGNLAIRDLGVAAYLGVPLTTPDGHVLGALCAIDDHPRSWGPEDASVLADLAAAVMTEVNLREEVAARREGAERLRAAAERHRLLMAGIRDHAIVTTDASGVVDGWDAGAERIFGYAAADVIGRGAAVLFTGEDRDAGVPGREMEFAAAVGRAEDSRWHVRKDGGRFFASGVMNPLRDGGGNLVGFVKVLRDETRRRQDEEHMANLLELQKQTAADAERQRRVYETALSSTPDHAYVLDLDLRFRFANRALLELWGRTRAEVAGRTMAELDYPPETAGFLTGEFRRVIEGKAVVRGEVPFAGNDGVVRTFDYIFAPVFGDDREVVALAGTSRDVTERRAVERELGDVRTRLETAMTFGDIATWVWDVRDDRLFADRNLARLFSIPEGPDGGHSVARYFGVIHPDDREPVAQALSRAVASGDRYACDYRVVCPDGSVRWLSARGGVVRDADGRAKEIPGVVVDVTDRKRAEEEVEAAGRAKDRFLAMLSHELRTPINPVLLTATAMLDDPRTPAEQRPTWEMIRDNIGLEARLIDDLLDVTRTIAGKMPYEFRHVDAHDLIGKAAEVVRGDFRDKAVRLVTRFDAARPHVKADAARLTQAFWNLLKNAAKFTEPGGLIEVRTRDDGGRLVVAIEDTGIGIEPEALAKVFNAFEQVEDSVTRRYGGLGLGLAITRSVVEAHGGRVTAASLGRGRGATFTIELDAVEPTAPGPVEPPGSAPPAPRAFRVLLVEDDAMTCRVMASLLRKAGHEVTAAVSYESALGHASPAFDLVVSDIGLPGRSGFQLMSELRRLHGLTGIALTGFGTELDVERSREAGFAAHVTKPVDFPKLEALIQRVGRAAGNE